MTQMTDAQRIDELEDAITANDARMQDLQDTNAELLEALKYAADVLPQGPCRTQADITIARAEGGK